MKKTKMLFICTGNYDYAHFSLYRFNFIQITQLCFSYQKCSEFFQVVGNLRTAENAHNAPISCLGVADDGSAVCTGSWDRNLKVIYASNLHDVYFTYFAF